MKTLRKVVVVGGVRTPFVKSHTKYKANNQDMLTACLNRLADVYNLKRVDEIVLGSITKAGTDWNMAREALLGSTLSKETPAYDIQRACGTSLTAAGAIANKIAMGQIEVGIAGGSDSNSAIALEFKPKASQKFIKLSRSRSLGQSLKNAAKFRPSDFSPKVPGVTEPRTGKSMGQHCELMAKRWKITREDQDQLAYDSHQKAAKAYDEGFYKDLVFNYSGIDRDTILRPETSLEKLATLRAAFDKKTGTLSAGNSTAMTDGAAVSLMCSEDYAKEHNLPISAYFVDVQSAALDFVNGAGLLMAPTRAVSDLLKRNNLKLQDFDYYEIHEAFAAQVLSTLKAWEDADYCKKVLDRDEPMGSIDRSKLNIKGSSLATGHPFCATGSRIVSTLSQILKEKKGRGLISVCTGGGMGVAAIMESP